MMRRRDAPIASRMPISRCRATPRASNRLATFAQPITRIRPNAKKQRHEQHHDVDRQRDRALSRFEREARRGSLDEARGRPVDRTLSRMPRVPHAELRERLAARHTGLQPPDNVDADGLFALPLAGAELAKRRERRPEIRRRDRLESSKALRHHADNPELRSVYPDRSVEYCGITGKMQGPGAMAEDDDRQGAWLIVRRCERAPAHCADTENVEVIPRDERPLPPVPFDPRFIGTRARERVGEHVRLADERFILRAREGLGLARWPIADVQPRTARAGCAHRPHER